jgi:hypothetical protein
VVVTGQLDALGLSEHGEELVASCGPGTFTGELNVLSGRTSVFGLARFFCSSASASTFKKVTNLTRTVLYASEIVCTCAPVVNSLSQHVLADVASGVRRG